MAAHAEQGVELGSDEPFNDYDAHRKTYMGFLTLLKWCMGGIIIILALMAFFLT